MALKFFAKNVFFLHLLAQYRPEPHWPLIVKILYYLLRLSIYVCFTGTLVFSFMGVIFDDSGQIPPIAINIVNILIYASIASRNIHFMYNSDVVEYLIMRLNTVMREKSKLGFEPYTMKQGQSVANRVHNSWNLFAIGAGMGMALSPFFKRKKELPLNYWLFYDWSDDRYYMPTLVFQTMSQIYMVSCFANIEMFNACFTILLRYQFKLLGIDFKNVFPDALHAVGMPQDDVEEFIKNKEEKHWVDRVRQIADTSQFQKKVLDNFKYCIQQHQEMLTFRDEFYNFITVQLSTELLFLMGYLIFSLFTVTITDDPTIHFALTQYFGGTICQIYMMCGFGEKLTMEVENLRNILYDIPWYYCDHTFQKNFKIVQLRMTKNDYLKAGKLLDMSLETFVEFLKSACSFFAVLRQVNDDAKA